MNELVDINKCRAFTEKSFRIWMGIILLLLVFLPFSVISMHFRFNNYLFKQLNATNILNLLIF